MNAAKPMHEAAAALGVIHCMSLCQAMLSSWAAARSLPRFLFYSSGKSEGFVAKSRLSLAKSLIIHNVLLSTLGGLCGICNSFSMPGATPAFRRSILHQLDAAYEFLCIVRRYRRVVLKEWNNAGRRPVTVLSLGVW